VSCGVSSYQHSSVALEFFETVVRYDKFFIVEPQHIPNVLVSRREQSPPVDVRLNSFSNRFVSGVRWRFWTNGG